MVVEEASTAGGAVTEEAGVGGQRRGTGSGDPGIEGVGVAVFEEGGMNLSLCRIKATSDTQAAGGTTALLLVPK